MTHTPEDHRRARFQGEAFAASHLIAVLRGGTSVEMTDSYAAGLIEGVRAWMSAHVSDRAAYDALQAVADRAGAPRVTGLSGEPGATEEAS